VNNKVLVGCLMLLLSLMVYLPLSSASSSVLVKSIRWAEGPRARLMVDFSAEPSYRISRSANASRLAIDLSDVALQADLTQPPAGHPVAAKIGALTGKARDRLRLLIDLKGPAEYQSHVEQFKDRTRLVIDWAAVPQGGKAAAVSAKPGPVPIGRPRPDGTFVVAIDAGHGGKDAGAIGHGGVQEKDVVLAIARKLAGLIRAEPGMKAIMVRKGDEFVDLRHRAAIARKAKADLFVSLHADAYVNDGVKGSSVFTLSDHGASSEAARWLANSENAALSGKAKPKDKSSDKVLASVLVDLSKNATLDASDKAAEKVLRELKKDFPVHHQDVQKAEFAVLKSLDVPSMLIETAFISNPAEERNLTNPKHQEQIARAVFNGIRAYRAGIRLAPPAADRVAGDVGG
jgi:N-acetylmuramoyl-L-alanine amidase